MGGQWTIQKEEQSLLGDHSKHLIPFPRWALKYLTIASSVLFPVSSAFLPEMWFDSLLSFWDPVCWYASCFNSNFIELQFTYHTILSFKGYSSMIFSVSWNCTAITRSILKRFYYPQKEPPIPKAVSLHSPSPNPHHGKRQWFSDTTSCLFWILHINGITQDVAFCNLFFFSFSAMFLRFIHIRAYANTWLLSVAQ